MDIIIHLLIRNFSCFTIIGHHHIFTVIQLSRQWQKIVKRIRPTDGDAKTQFDSLPYSFQSVIHFGTWVSIIWQRTWPHFSTIMGYFVFSLINDNEDKHFKKDVMMMKPAGSNSTAEDLPIRPT